VSSYRVLSFHRNRRGPPRGACSEGERCEDYRQTGSTFFDIVSASCNSYAGRPPALFRRAWHVSRALWACCSQLSIDIPEDRVFFRAPAPSVNERSFPAQPATGGTESTRATGKVAAELRAVTRTSMPADPLRPATSNHAFLTHAARVAACGVLLGERAVERSEERLN
jgi:hypothetical protein